MKILPYLCLELPVQEVYLPRPECAAVEIDWQLLSPVSMFNSMGITMYASETKYVHGITKGTVAKLIQYQTKYKNWLAEKLVLT